MTNKESVMGKIEKSLCLFGCILPCLLHAAFFDNPDFERTETLPDGFSIDLQGGRNHTRALHCVKNDPEQNLEMTRKLNLKPGRQYRVSWWMRGKSDPGHNKMGASCFLEYRTSGGSVLKRNYVKGLTAESISWKCIGMIADVPPETKEILLKISFPRGAMGNVWFDDFTVEEDILDSGEIFSNADFELGEAFWKLPDGFEVVPGAGRNGTAALHLVRRKGAPYSEIRRTFSLKKGQTYRIGCWVKGNVTEPGSYNLGGTFNLAFLSAGKVINRLYLKGLNGLSANWQFISKEIAVPPNADCCMITIYLSRNGAGEVWYDDFTATPVNEFSICAVWPGMGLLDGKNPRLKFAVDYSGGECPKNYAVRLTSGMFPAMTAKLCSGFADFMLKPLAPGDFSVTAELLDPAGNVTLKRDFALKVSDSACVERPANPVSFDEQYGLLVNGKPFLPIGIFVGHIRKNELEELKKSAINCLIPYASMSMRPKPDEPNPAKNSAGALDQIRRAMDLAQDAGFGVFFSLQNVYEFEMNYRLNCWFELKGADQIVEHVVSGLKQHPALLGWYINDERPLNQLDSVENRRRQINRLDRFHPTLSLSMQFTMMYRYAPTGDVIMVDPYPIVDRDSQDMRVVEVAGRMCRKTGVPWWGTPQLFRFGGVKDFDRYRDPTENELRAMCLQMVLDGAKGFVFYHYNDLIIHENQDPGYYRRRFGEFCRTTEMLKMLSEYILSPEKTVETVLTNRHGAVRSLTLTRRDGRRAVIITALGPGEASADLVLRGGFQSLYGFSRQKSDGVWCFSGSHIAADILLENCSDDQNETGRAP